MKRKDFVKGVCLLSAAGLLESLLESCVNDHLVLPSLPSPSSKSQLNIPNNNTNGGTNLTSSNAVNSTTSGTNVTTTGTSNIATSTGSSSVTTSAGTNLSTTTTTSNIPANPILTLDLTIYSNLNSTGGYVNQSNIIVINTGSGFVALSNICTHQGCAVLYFNHQIVCPCHSGYYDLNGKVTGGPPPRPLQKYSTLLIGTTLYVS